MIAKLRKLLADCHMAAGDKTVKILGEANLFYLIQRADEELDGIDTATMEHAEIDRKFKLVVQLVTIARSKLSVNQDPDPKATRMGRKKALPEGQP